MSPLSTNMEPDREKDSKSVLQEEALKKLQELLAQVKDKKKLVEVLANDGPKRPKGWSSLSNAPYFKERFALEFKMVLDAMIAEYKEGRFEDREYKYSEFCQPGVVGSLSRNSLYLKINQSKLYLLKELDFDGTYKEFCELLTITKERTGIRISYVRDIRQGLDFKMPSKVVPKTETFSWKDKVDSFLENGQSGDKLELTGLSIDEDQQQDIIASLSGLSDIIFKVTDSSIKIVKLSPEQLHKLGEEK